jgi:adenosylmethionine-8-amino-7-oxononanoate aminotransferase
VRYCIVTMINRPPEPESAIFHRSLDKHYNTASGGEGVYIFHPDGSRTLDGSSGAAVSCLGHGHRTVIDAICNQARKMAFAHTSFFTSDPAEELAQLLIDESDHAFTKIMFLSSGSEAVESAIKLARQYHVANGESQRVNFVCRKYAYHGNTIGALSAGFNPTRRTTFEPILSSSFHHVEPCFYSRDGRKNESEAAYVDRLILEYEELFDELGPSTIAAVMVEPISGATLGAVPAAEGYLSRLRSICDKYGALLIFDEVMCGMGRAGTLHAWQSLGNVAPDLQAIGKGLGAGYQPISAVMVNSEVHQVLQRTSGTHPFTSGHTYQGHSIGCAAALATQRTIIDADLLRNVRDMGELLRQELSQRVPEVKEVRGVGLFQAVEFKTLCGQQRLAPDVAGASLKNGAAVYQCSPAVDAILLAPPFIISRNEVRHLVDIFVASVKQTLMARGITEA